MTRAEKASDATLDEILASIRRIIADEPDGTRPLAAPKPKPPLANAAANNELAIDMTGKPTAPTPVPAEQPTSAGPALSSLRPAGARPPQPTAPTAPTVDAMPSPATELSVSQQKPEREPSIDSAFGRLADALGGNRRAMPPTTTTTTTPEPQPAPVASASAHLVDDLSDLLDDIAPLPSVPEIKSATPPSAPREPLRAPAPTAMAAVPDEFHALGDGPSPLRRDSENGRTIARRTIARRTIDLGSIVPGRDDAPANGRPVAKADSGPSLTAPLMPPAIEELPGALPRPSSQSRAMDKMLSARIASATVKATPPEPEVKGPVVIASMAAPAPATIAEPETPAVDAEVAGFADASDFDADAASAFDLLAAGLAGSDASQDALAPVSKVDAPDALASEPPVHTAFAPEPAPPTRRPAVSTAAPQLPLSPPPAPVTMAVQPEHAAPATPAPSDPQSVAMTVAAAPQAPTAVSLAPLVGVRTIEDMVAELLRPMLREWLAENMPRMVEKALRIELAEGLKTVNHAAVAPPRKIGEK